MRNEIKEILEFKEDADYKRLSCDEIKVIEDYITNLQEENKLLKEDYSKIVQDNCYTLELEQRIDKAIEYIKWNLDKNEEIIEYFNYDGNFNELLNILRGDE